MGKKFLRERKARNEGCVSTIEIECKFLSMVHYH
jgi:hypothetical protein